MFFWNLQYVPLTFRSLHWGNIYTIHLCGKSLTLEHLSVLFTYSVPLFTYNLITINYKLYNMLGFFFESQLFLKEMNTMRTRYPPTRSPLRALLRAPPPPGLRALPRRHLLFSRGPGRVHWFHSVFFLLYFSLENLCEHCFNFINIFLFQFFLSLISYCLYV